MEVVPHYIEQAATYIHGCDFFGLLSIRPVAAFLKPRGRREPRPYSYAYAPASPVLGVYQRVRYRVLSNPEHKLKNRAEESGDGDRCPSFGLRIRKYYKNGKLAVRPTAS